MFYSCHKFISSAYLRHPVVFSVYSIQHISTYYLVKNIYIFYDYGAFISTDFYLLTLKMYTSLYVDIFNGKSFCGVKLFFSGKFISIIRFMVSPSTYFLQFNRYECLDNVWNLFVMKSYEI